MVPGNTEEVQMDLKVRRYLIAINIDNGQVYKLMSLFQEWSHMLNTFVFVAVAVPTSLPHDTAEDSTLGGYDIPKGTAIFTNLYAVHMNPEIFPEPKKFKPERYLDDEGKAVRPETLAPFGLGRCKSL